VGCMNEQGLIVHLVRHGETPLNAEGRFLGRTDVELSARGRVQAEAVAESLGARELRAVFTSPLGRARQTAEPIARVHGLVPVAVEALSELHHGEMEGRPYAELAERFPEVMRAWVEDCASVVLPGGESLEELQRRAWEGFEALASSGAGELCVVSHRMALVTIVCAAIGLPLRHAMRLELDLGSVTTLDRRPGRGWRLLRLNAVPAGREGSRD
jgi:broad specificity phosphatase PhoE